MEYYSPLGEVIENDNRVEFHSSWPSAKKCTFKGSKNTPLLVTFNATLHLTSTTQIISYQNNYSMDAEVAIYHHHQAQAARANM